MTKCLFGFVAVLAMIVAVPAWAGAQGKSEEPAVRAAFTRMVNADLSDNADELEKNIWDDFTVTRDNGVVRSRAETLDGLRSGATSSRRLTCPT